MENLKETMDQLQFSENAEDNMLRAMRLAQEEKKTENKVGKVIRIRRVKQWAVSFIAIALVLIIFTNSSVQAAIYNNFMNLYENIFNSFNSSYKDYITEQDIDIEQDGYKLHVYSFAQGDTTVTMEYELLDKAGNDAMKDGTFYMDVIDGWDSGENVFSDFQLNRDGHYISVTFSDYPITKTSSEISMIYMGKDTVKFVIPYKVDNVFKNQRYEMNYDCSTEDMTFRVDYVVDTGMFYQVFYTYNYGDMKEKDYAAFELRATCDGTELQPFSGSSSENQGNTFFDKESMAGKTVVFTPVAVEASSGELHELTEMSFEYTLPNPN